MNKYFITMILATAIFGTACSSAQKNAENTVSQTAVRQTEAAVLAPLTINFAFDSANMPKKSYSEVKLFVKNIEQENFIINIDGYTDDIGTEIYNNKLSMQRAEAVADYLIDNGINSDIIVTRGHGMNDFVADNDTEENRAKNRRVEISISKK